MNRIIFMISVLVVGIGLASEEYRVSELLTQPVRSLQESAVPPHLRKRLDVRRMQVSARPIRLKLPEKLPRHIPKRLEVRRMAISPLPIRNIPKTLPRHVPKHLEIMRMQTRDFERIRFACQKRMMCPEGEKWDPYDCKCRCR